MKTVKIAPPKFGPNVRAYKKNFGHMQSAEDMKWRNELELEAMAAEALERGEPIDRWKNRSKKRAVIDGWYSKR